MTKRIITSTILSLSILHAAAAPEAAPVIYSNGVKDTLSLTENFFKDAKVFTSDTRTKILKGYVTYTDAVSLNEAEIVRMAAVGIKNGYDVSFLSLDGRDVICYSVTDRKPDAEYIQKRLSTYNIDSRVVKVDTKVLQVNLVGRDLIGIITKNLDNLSKDKDKRIEQLERYVKTIAVNTKTDTFPNIEKDKEIYGKSLPSQNKTIISSPPSTAVMESPAQNCAPCSECPQSEATSEKIDLSSLQVVNRVITKKYLKKYANNNIKIVKPLNKKQMEDMTVETVEKQIRTVSKNIKKDVSTPLPKLPTFVKAFNYIREHAAVTKDGKLIMNGKAYSVGDKIDKWKLTDIEYQSGVIVIDELFVSGINKK